MSKPLATCLHIMKHTGQARVARLEKGNLYPPVTDWHGCRRTQLEAEAYAAHIAGLQLLEYPDRKPAALSKLQRAQSVSSTADEEPK